MPTDFQIIDTFERLREAFTAENPGYVPTPRRLPEGFDPAAWVAEAWVQAIEGDAAAGAQQRRVRALARAILAGKAAADGDGFEEPRTREWAALLPERLASARAKRYWPLDPAAPERIPADEVRAWGRILPGLTGLRAWRFVERLGRPLVVPESPVRRFLWRFGLLETPPGRSGSLRQSHSLLERTARVTGLTPALLDTLIHWCVGGDRGLAGGRWCVARPRCATCPCRPDCAWARFHPHGERDHLAGDLDRRTLEPIRRQIAAGRQDQLQEAELLAVILQRGGPEQDVLEVAETLLRRMSDLRGIEKATLAELTEISGVSENRAAQLKAALELGRRLATRALTPGSPITCSEDVFRAFCSRFRHLPQEHFIIVLVDAKNRVIHDHIVSKGTLTGSLAHPREVFHEAIRHSAAGVILLHNHPSGDPQPSREDKSVTIRLKEAGDILGIRVLDHIVLGAEDYYSFKDEGEL